ncbi:uncharacterized protein BKA78DRAFT_299187 [Phyllosticta capitalensis]|uniref:uncharacterized protein n=1 Tax=Phyllosticta capitalensis TaxID=121624 RepID=UPI003130AF8E
MDPSHDMDDDMAVDDLAVKTEDFNRNPVDLDDGISASPEYMSCALLTFIDLIKQSWVSKIVAHYEEIRRARNFRVFADERTACMHLRGTISGTFEIPVFKNDPEAKAMGVLCDEALKVLVSKEYFSFSRPSPQEQDADRMMDTIATTQALKAEWGSRLSECVAVPVAKRPLRFSLRQAAHKFMVNTLEGHIDFPTKKQRAEQNKGQEQAKSQAQEAEVQQAMQQVLAHQDQDEKQIQGPEAKDAMKDHSASCDEPYQRGYKAGFEAGRAAAMAEAMQLLRNQPPTLDGDHGTSHGQSTAAHTADTDMTEINDSVDIMDPVESMKKLALEDSMPCGSSKTEQSVVGGSPFVKTPDMSSHRSLELKSPSAGLSASAVGPQRPSALSGPNHVAEHASLGRNGNFSFPSLGSPFGNPGLRTSPLQSQPTSPNIGFDKTPRQHSGPVPSPSQSQTPSTVFGSTRTQLGQVASKQPFQHAGAFADYRSMNNPFSNPEHLSPKGAAGLEGKSKRRLSESNLENEELQMSKKARGDGI